MSTTKIDVPDSIRPYLNEIAERLWAERAAVMVGAGFSKNAGDGFPDWNQLGDLFYHKAHGVMPDPAKLKYLNALRLAEEVQAAIGRPALENLLRSNIPDLNFEPSGLHVDLLELPWVDVLTTNYDTLLERASTKVVTRRYEPVVNKEDIPYAIKPRIVKLHGSFPSERPFVITEEDYRRYPHDYAPFVNTVQQALLENTFCLIGFSGDDPNFLQWIGWIRDNLGKDKTQKIYLVGVFDLSSARLQLLAQRGIIVVDLSCCDGIDKHDHKKALNRFLAYVRSKKPDILNWPNDPHSMHPDRDKDRIEEFWKISEDWRRQRLNYPGWLILPSSNRKNLWVYINSWIHHLPNIEESPPGLDLQYVFELVWRLERCLLPLFENIAQFSEKLLVKYWPFPNEDLPANCQIHSGEKKFQDLPWSDLQQAWLAIALSMLRFYREEGCIDKWKEMQIRLLSLSNYLLAEQKEFLYYEDFLFNIFTLDLPKAKLSLENWRPSEAQPYWMAKQAAALAEMGLLSEAEAIIRVALENIRKKLNQNAGTSDLTLVSLESSAMLLGKYIQDASGLERGEREDQQDRKSQLNDRWNELRGFKCDPWNEIELFELTLKNPPIERKVITEKRVFDIGRVSRTRHINNYDHEGLSAYSFLRFCEEIGLPFRLGSYAMAKKTALGSLLRISKYSSFWAFATLARTGDAKAADSLFSRESVYKFTADEADQLIQSYIDALNKCRDDIQAVKSSREYSYSVRLTHLLPEVISRLCCKCSYEMKLRILQFIIGIYASPNKIKYQNVNKLINRLLSSMSEVERYRLIPNFLKIPFPEGLDSFKQQNDFPNPFLSIELNQKPECAPAVEIQSELVDHLFRQANLDNSDRRRWAITSLVTLHNLKLLDDRQSQNFAEAIWCSTDESGLPDVTDFYKFAFLTLPYPEEFDPTQLFKNHVMSTNFPIQKNSHDKGVTMTGGDIPIVREIIGANVDDESIWTDEDAAEILQRVLEWWDADKDRLNEKERETSVFPSIHEEFRARFARMLELLAEVLSHHLSINSPDGIKHSLRQLLKEVRESGLPSLTAEAACLHIYPDHKADVYSRINEALISNQEKIQKDGLRAIAKIMLDCNDAAASSVEPEPISMLSEYLKWSSLNSIILALWVIVRILKKTPTSFTHGLELATLRRLDRLLNDTAYDIDSPDLNFNEKLEVRHVSSILAAALWSYYDSLGSTVPEVVEKWRTECLTSNEFSEIRNPWKDIKELCDSTKETNPKKLMNYSKFH